MTFFAADCLEHFCRGCAACVGRKMIDILKSRGYTDCVDRKMIDILKSRDMRRQPTGTQFATLCAYEDMNSRHELATGEGIRGLKKIDILASHRLLPTRQPARF